MKRVKVSNNVIRRLPRYLRKLDELQENGISRISSFELGQQLGLTPSQIRHSVSRATGTMFPDCGNRLHPSSEWTEVTGRFWSVSATSDMR